MRGQVQRAYGLQRLGRKITRQGKEMKRQEGEMSAAVTMQVAAAYVLMFIGLVRSVR